MKYQFSKSTKFVPSWNGNRDLPKEEQVSMTVSVLSMGHVLELMGLVEGGAKNGDVDSETLDAKTTSQLVEKARQILPEYISDFSNLEGPEGPIDVATICEYPQFISLIIEILFELISISTPSEQDVKN